MPPQIPPLHFNIPLAPPIIIPGDDPFAIPAPVHQSVEFNGHQYHHLPPCLAEALQNMHPEPLAPS